jgi:hypothetical protein
MGCVSGQLSDIPLISPTQAFISQFLVLPCNVERVSFSTIEQTINFLRRRWPHKTLIWHCMTAVCVLLYVVSTSKLGIKMFLLFVQIDTLRLGPGRRLRLLPNSHLAQTMHQLDFVDSTLCSFTVSHFRNLVNVANFCLH